MKIYPSNLALIGFRASGKSLVGKLLAQKLGLSFIDMDDCLTDSFGSTIDRWVRIHGWTSFREAEGKLLEELATRSGLVLATGGGVILKPENRKLLSRHFFVIWLKASPQTTFIRLQKDPKTSSNRPALTHLPLKEEIEKTLNERCSLYAETADLIIETDRLNPNEITALIASEIQKIRPGSALGVGNTGS